MARNEQHTPGPWRVDNEFNQVQSPKGETLVLSFGRTATKNDKILIASAPELLEALKEMTEQIQRQFSLGSDPVHYELMLKHQKGLQAIAKAEGKK
jgi:hypothetical protein